MDLLTPAERIFDALVSRLKGTAFPLPERRFITVADIVFDCDQLAVSARQVIQGHPGQQLPGPILPRGGYVENSMEVGIAYSVCSKVANKGIPTAKDVDREGREFLFNAALLVTAMYDAYYAHEFTGPCQEANLSPVVFIQEGGVMAVTQVVNVQVS